MTRLPLVTAICLLAALPASAAVRHSSRLRKSAHSTVKHTSSAESASIPPERATQIQTALIRQGYMSGQPSGVWDASTISAMQKLQGDNGWQTKMVPSARGLIKLGLGPGASATPPGSVPQNAASPQ